MLTRGRRRNTEDFCVMTAPKTTAARALGFDLFKLGSRLYIRTGIRAQILCITRSRPVLVHEAQQASAGA